MLWWRQGTQAGLPGIQNNNHADVGMTESSVRRDLGHGLDEWGVEVRIVGVLVLKDTEVDDGRVRVGVGEGKLAAVATVAEPGSVGHGLGGCSG